MMENHNKNKNKVNKSLASKNKNRMKVNNNLVKKNKRMGKVANIFRNLKMMVKMGN